MTAPAKHVWIALLVVYVVWGSTYFGIKVAVDTIPPLLAAGSRFLVAGLVLATILAWRGTSLRVNRRELAACALVGGLLLGLGVGLVHVAETRIDSSVAAMIAGTVPLQIIVLRLVSGENPARATRLSTLTGLCGLGLVVAPGLGAGSTALGLAVMVLQFAELDQESWWRDARLRPYAERAAEGVKYYAELGTRYLEDHPAAQSAGLRRLNA